MTLHEWILELGRQFAPGEYLALTRIQGILWTAADYVIVVYLLRGANLIRGHVERRNHRVPWLALAATVPFALGLLIAPDGNAFFRLELVVTIPHFALILYTLAANLRAGTEFLAALRASPRHAAPIPAERTRRRPPPA